MFLVEARKRLERLRDRIRKANGEYIDDIIDLLDADAIDSFLQTEERQMGIIASDMADAIDRQRHDIAGAMTDLRAAKLVELVTGPGGQVWVNVDGHCVLRVARVDSVYCDTSNALSTDKRV